MEKLKSAIPEALKQRIAASTADDLTSTCSSLINFFQNLPLFHQMVKDLTDPETALCGKNQGAALEAKASGNECFSNRDYSNALRLYSQALRNAPMDVEDKEKNLVATLYVNRASALQNLGFFLESLRDCSRALTLHPSYAKAWFRRAKANSSLGNYDDAIKDLNVSLKIETSLSGKRQIESELNVLLNQSRSGRATEKSNGDSSDELLQMELKCVSTQTKGRGMASSTNIPVASLIHREDPYAAIILKHCREAHCAFCFNELPADTVPCTSCSIPLYCSLKCQVQAGGQEFLKYKNGDGLIPDLPEDLQHYIQNVTSLGFSDSSIKHTAEHRHECQGVHWSAVLPPDVVLAGRILAKHIQQLCYGGTDPQIHKILDLFQNYGQLSPEIKLEFHVYSVILLCCLQQHFASKLPLNSATTSEIIIVLSQIRVNSMAVIRMRYSDGKQHLEYDGTSSVEQVQVAQAVYYRGSLFNHSCQPNVHAYFLSRTLFIRATENVVAGSELELSYGPQVGQWNCCERRRSLEDQYSFTCKCIGCAQVNLSDLVHSGYRCVRPECFGVVLDSSVARYEREKIKLLQRPNTSQARAPKDNYIGKVARSIFEQTDYNTCFRPGFCLSCGSSCDPQTLQNRIAKAENCIRRLQDSVSDGEISTDIITEALENLEVLRNHLHPFNKRIAEVEDNIAQAFCINGELQAAREHCRASIEILEKLYGENHIVIGNELIKLESIQHCIGQNKTVDNTNRIVAIFSRHYGSHAEVIFPHLLYLKKEASKLV